MVCQNSSVIASRSAKSIGVVVAGVPALLISTSRPPSASMPRATIASASPGTETLPAASAWTVRPSAVSRLASSGPRASSARW